MSRCSAETITSIRLVANEQLDRVHCEDDAYLNLLHAAVMLVDSIMLLADEGRLPTDCGADIEEQLTKLLAQVKNPDWLAEVKAMDAATNVEAEIKKIFQQVGEVPAH